MYWEPGSTVYGQLFATAGLLYIILHTLWAVKKHDALLLFISSPNINQFSHWRYTSDVMCHLAVGTSLWLKTYTGSTIYFRQILAEFLKINCNRERGGMSLTETWETCSTDQRHETGRLKHTRTEENMITDEMVGLLNHKGQKQTYRLTRQISKETDLTV